MKKIKRVFTGCDQVLHLWANQAQDSARCANVFFEGLDCFSYGYHYPLGRLVQYKGKTVALINEAGHSVTTAKHIRRAFEAASHLLCLGVNDSSELGNVKAGILKSQDQLVSELFNHFSMRNPWQRFDRSDDYSIGNRVEKFNGLCDQLGFPKLKIDIDQDFEELFNGHAKACKERLAELEAVKHSPEAIAKREALKLRKAELELEKAAGAIEAWRQGGSRPWAVSNLRPQILRIKGETVETSGGAEVPLAHALRLLDLIEKGQAKKGEKVGHFSVDQVSDLTVSIGCHNIALSEARAVLAGAVAKPKLSIVSLEGAANERL